MGAKRLTGKMIFTLLLMLILSNQYLYSQLSGDMADGKIKRSCEKLFLDAGSPVRLVDPLVDAANSRWFFFSSACRPFGMVNLSPDMVADGAWNSGYRYNEDTILFFSHIHAWQMSGIPVMPITGTFRGFGGPHAYGSKYSHQNEFVRPGYHAVYLEDYDIWAELTSTTRTGFHRYTFPSSENSYILLDLSTVLGPSRTESGYARMVNKREIEGYAIMAGTVRRPKPLKVYYVIQLDTPFDQMEAWQNGRTLGRVKTFEGSGGGAGIHFKTAANQRILMKVGISYTSTDAARNNIEVELPEWNFEKVVHDSWQEWNSFLGRIEINGGTYKQQRRFYTDLWHALQGRRIVSDAAGTYIDNTGPRPRVGQIPKDREGKPAFNHYNSDAFWGAQWTLNTLWHLVYPEISEQFVNSMLLMYDDGGLIPRGPSGGNYTFVMTGASTTPFIVSAWMKGIRGFDAEKAYQGMRKNAFPGGMMSKAGYEHTSSGGGGIEYYIDRGYVPYPLDTLYTPYHQDGAGQTLEYAYQDWCLSQMAKSLGKVDDYRLFMDRAGNYANLFDTQTGWMRPRGLDGSWLEPFDPLIPDVGFIEANAAQSTWYVPQDVAGLARLMGGNDKFNLTLNRSFEIAEQHDFYTKSSGYHDPVVQEERAKQYLNYGNQPSMETAFLFNYTGAPWLTQYWSREVANRIYSGLSPQSGYNGDEDQGLMGSLAVLMKIGLFEIRGGAAVRPVYEIGSPVFDTITLHLNQDYYKGKTFTIRTVNNSDHNRYIRSAELNGRPLHGPCIYHGELTEGGELILEMGAIPDKKWGSRKEDAPPSMSVKESE